MGPRRVRPPAFTAHDPRLPRIDAILLSHNHYGRQRPAFPHDPLSRIAGKYRSCPFCLSARLRSHRTRAAHPFSPSSLDFCM